MTKWTGLPRRDAPRNDKAVVLDCHIGSSIRNDGNLAGLPHRLHRFAMTIIEIAEIFFVVSSLSSRTADSLQLNRTS
ncbi:MAG: hypothetical protein WC710_13230 [Gallionella sp.]|jgi:hypothetical protein